MALVPSEKENDASLASPVESPEEPILALTLSTEPESIIESQTEGSITALDEPHETTATISTTGMASSDGAGDEENEAIKTAMRLAYMMVHGEGGNDKELEWFLALNVMEAMLPGFIDGYLQFKKECDQADEERAFAKFYLFLLILCLESANKLSELESSNDKISLGQLQYNT